MLKIKTKAIKKLESQMKAFKESALPFATRQAINSVAFAAQRIAKDKIRNDFINRNKFTEKSIRVEKTRSLDINQQRSVVGSVADYMDIQESGGIKRKTGKHGVTIPTSVAAGQAEGTKPRRKVPRSANKMRAIRLRDQKKYGSKRQQAKIAVFQAASGSQKYIFLDLGKTKGIFKVSGSPKKPRVKMMYDMSRTEVIIKKHEWLAPSVMAAKKILPNLYFKALKQQLIRHNLFKKL